MFSEGNEKVFFFFFAKRARCVPSFVRKKSLNLNQTNFTLSRERLDKRVL